MREVSELFEHLLNFGDEWKVTNLAVDDAQRQVEVHVKYTAMDCMLASPGKKCSREGNHAGRPVGRSQPTMYVLV